jgi:hypothetical protein
MSYYGNYVRARLADRLPSLEFYREAKLWHDAVKPFSKGRKVGQKPLGQNRKYDRFTIRAEYDYKSDTPTKQNLIVKHYDTDILKYNADGSFFIKTDYDSISTVQGLQELLGADKFVRRKLKAYYKDRNGHFFRIKGGLKVNADGVADTTDFKPEIVHEIDRPAFKKLRNDYKEFMEYVYFTNNLTQGGEAYSSTLKLESVESGNQPNFFRKNAGVALSIDTVQMKWHRNPQLVVREAFFAELEDAMRLEGEDKYTKYHHLATFLSFSAATTYNGTTWNSTGNDRYYKWQVDNKRLRQFFDGLLKFRFPMLVFKEVEAEVGVIRHDTNAKYFEFGTL